MANALATAAESLWAELSPRWPDVSVEVVAEIDSTNSELMRRARAGEQRPTLLIAERQVAGRGRLGRTWDSATAEDVGASLTCSLGLPFAPVDWSGLSLVVGVALVEALHPRIGLKWPNDLWVDDRKLGGILVETAVMGDARYAVIGTGLNIRPLTSTKTPATAIDLQSLDARFTAASLLTRMVPPLVQALQQFEALGFAPFMERFNARDVLRDRDITLSDGQHGSAHGVDETGALRVHTASGLQRVTSAEVSVRPTAWMRA